MALQLHMRVRVILRLSLLAVAAIAINGTALQAQEHNAFAVGVKYTQHVASDQGVHADRGIGITWRTGHSPEGWGWSYGLGWFASNIDQSVGGRNLRLGELKVRPVVGGYGYTRRIARRWSVTGDLVGGLAFTTFDLAPEGAKALGFDGAANESRHAYARHTDHQARSPGMVPISIASGASQSALGTPLRVQPSRSRRQLAARRDVSMLTPLPSRPASSIASSDGHYPYSE